MRRSSSPTVPRVALFLPSLEGGGTERVFVELANEFAAHGARVDFALASARGPYLDEVSAGVRVIDFRARGVLHALPRLAHYLRSEHPRSMLSGLNHANVAAVLARRLSMTETRCVVSVRSLPTVVHREAGSKDSWALLQVMRLIYPLADAIVANSAAVAEDVSGLLRSRSPAPQVVYNPLNLPRIEALSRAEVDSSWAEGAPMVLGVGSLTVLKDFETLVRAFARVRAQRDCRLVILGEGPERPRLASLIRELGLERDAHLPGFVNNPFSWMRRAAVFVSSSLTEGCPNALMQALACGARVVGTDCAGGSAEILQQGAWGRLTPVGDPRAMAETILAAMDDTNAADSRRRAGDFAHDRIARRYLEILVPEYAPLATEG